MSLVSKKRVARKKPRGQVTVEFILLAPLLFILLLLCLEVVVTSVRYGQDWYGTFQIARALEVDKSARGTELAKEMAKLQPVDLKSVRVTRKAASDSGDMSFDKNETWIKTKPANERKLWTGLFKKVLNPTIEIPVFRESRFGWNYYEGSWRKGQSGSDATRQDVKDDNTPKSGQANLY